jgi:hypothetical protein
MGRLFLATAFMTLGFGAQAMPQFQSQYLCTAPNGNSVALTFEVRDGKLFLFGLGGDLAQKGMDCVNQPTQTETIGAMKISLAGSCDDKKIYVESGVDMGAGSAVMIKIGITKTSDTQAEISVDTKGSMNGQAVDGGGTLTCVK